MPNASLDNLFLTPQAFSPAGATVPPPAGVGREFDDALRRAGQGPAAAPGGKRSSTNRPDNEADSATGPRDDSPTATADRSPPVATPSQSRDDDPSQTGRRKDESDDSATTQALDGSAAAAAPRAQPANSDAPTTSDNAGAKSPIAQVAFVGAATTAVIESQIQVAPTADVGTTAGGTATNLPAADGEESTTVELTGVIDSTQEDVATSVSDVDLQIDEAPESISPTAETGAIESTLNQPLESKSADVTTVTPTAEQDQSASVNSAASVASPSESAPVDKPPKPAPRRANRSNESIRTDEKLALQKAAFSASKTKSVASASRPEVPDRADTVPADDSSHDRHASATNQPATLSNSPNSDGFREAAANASARLSTSGSTRNPVGLGQTSPSNAVDQARFVQRVAKAFRTADPDGGQIRLRLSPPELGSMKLEIAVRNGVMTARMETETSAARTLLLDNLPALRDRLANQNIKIERFDVDLRQEGRGDGSPNPPPDFAGSRHPAPRPHVRATAGGAGPAEVESTGSKGLAGSSGANGQINVVI